MLMKTMGRLRRLRHDVMRKLSRSWCMAMALSGCYVGLRSI